MKNFYNYLNFNGNCRQAMEFYAECLGADVQIMPYSAGPADMPKDQKSANLVLHSRLSKGDAMIMASDCPPGMPLQMGNNFSISVDCDSREEVDKLFTSLGEKGKVVMPVQDMFWGDYFGMVNDQFGVNWMFNHTPKK